MTSLLVLSLCFGLAPTTASASAPAAAKVESLPFDPSAWKDLAQVELRVTESGKPVTYTGVPLAIVLKGQLEGKPAMAALRSLSDQVILVTAADGYRTAVSAAAVGMDPKGERYLLALKREGQPLGDQQGPVRLIVTGDPMHVRWVRMVSSLALVKIDLGN
ncbi:molybdopterin-dependent oxidoreductase [Singulisphaera acidiphila]|uniref:Putative molybdopterin-dependent oxidoreductase n=1 Tax=Singulisphaera acidiphila (strain ATCC BAA-1392 / DSM 18658 / VKM B-2454 / MOB10) TaxID=886293 RepID=L0D8U6_SINAD|nr:molybdopterin-dependent oxidoreductase [Singulisphaera acidiphila]AGA25819.1 putative molybdopterin-dependent oxidoreductase [Singulisphaera acidiphila DSM 18658]